MEAETDGDPFANFEHRQPVVDFLPERFPSLLSTSTISILRISSDLDMKLGQTGADNYDVRRIRTATDLVVGNALRFQ